MMYFEIINNCVYAMFEDIMDNSYELAEFKNENKLIMFFESII